jgi:glutaredoxin
VAPTSAAQGHGGPQNGLVDSRVVLYHAAGCHLCERARGVLDDAGVAYSEVDVTGDPELEARYREWLPVVEIDGRRAFAYFVDPDALRRKLRAQSP